MTNGEVKEINQLVAHFQDTADVGIHIWSIPPERLTWVAYTDASLNNASEDGSQGAMAILAADAHAGSGKVVCASLVCWKSCRLHRTIDSSLHAEILSLNNGVGELGWVMTLFHEFCYGAFRLDLWESWCERRRKLVLAGFDPAESTLWLRRALAIVDAKSLYDYLQKEGTGGRGRGWRCAIQVQVTRQAMN